MFKVETRSRRNISFLVPHPPAKAHIKVINIDFLQYIKEMYLKWFCNSSSTSQHKRSRYNICYFYQKLSMGCCVHDRIRPAHPLSLKLTSRSAVITQGTDAQWIDTVCVKIHYHYYNTNY